MDNKINGRTPEEIKKGLECCQHNPYNGLCQCDEGCPYRWTDRCDNLRKDALAYIQQLERERDAAVEDIFQTCANCKHEKLGYGVGPCPPVEEYVKINDCSNWQWRGVQEVE